MKLMRFLYCGDESKHKGLLLKGYAFITRYAAAYNSCHTLFAVNNSAGITHCLL